MRALWWRPASSGYQMGQVATTGRSPRILARLLRYIAIGRNIS